MPSPLPTPIPMEEDHEKHLEGNDHPPDNLRELEGVERSERGIEAGDGEGGEKGGEKGKETRGEAGADFGVGAAGMDVTKLESGPLSSPANLFPLPQSPPLPGFSPAQFSLLNNPETPIGNESSNHTIRSELFASEKYVQPSGYSALDIPPKISIPR